MTRSHVQVLNMSDVTSSYYREVLERDCLKKGLDYCERLTLDTSEIGTGVDINVTNTKWLTITNK
jgi:hypothetical protein